MSLSQLRILFADLIFSLSIHSYPNYHYYIWYLCDKKRPPSFEGWSNQEKWMYYRGLFSCKPLLLISLVMNYLRTLLGIAPVKVFMVVADGCISTHSTHITNYISMKYFYFLLYLYYSNGIFARHTHINNLEIGNTVFCRLLSTMG